MPTFEAGQSTIKENNWENETNNGDGIYGVKWWRGGGYEHHPRVEGGVGDGGERRGIRGVRGV